MGKPSLALGLGLRLAALFGVLHRDGRTAVTAADPDPYGYPRPAPDENHVPTRTSLFFQLGFPAKARRRRGAARHGGSSAPRPGRAGGGTAAAGPALRRRVLRQGLPRSRKAQALAVYIDRQAELAPATTYAVAVRARSRQGAVLDGDQGSWRFTTEAAATTHAVRLPLDLASAPVRWHGGFFTGFCKPSFCTSASNRISSYELMDRVRRQSPQAWSLQRDFWLTGMEHQPEFLSPRLPNVVRERETRRITAMEKCDTGIRLQVEDFFGHEQYGIAADRPLADDYHPGDEVLVADGVHHAQAKVVAIAADSREARSLVVTPFDEPAGGWRIAYAGPLPKQEDRRAPGLFPPGGCYLRKLRPAGTPHYYWGRVDAEWDLGPPPLRPPAGRELHRRARRPGDRRPQLDLSEGLRRVSPGDPRVHHALARALRRCLPGLRLERPERARPGRAVLAQRRLERTAEVLRLHGRRRAAGLRGPRLRLEAGGRRRAGDRRDLRRTHRAAHPAGLPVPLLAAGDQSGALPKNAAVADPRLDGRRSRRVEELCRTADGQGSPCDFISVHSYNASPVTAAKLIRAKELALEIDAEYYAGLWVNCFESCPNWAPPPDVAADDSYLGNGYFPTWCAEVARRLLARAAEDRRYAYGESLLTFWPWPNSNFGGHNDATRVIAVDDNGDGQPDREETVANADHELPGPAGEHERPLLGPARTDHRRPHGVRVCGPGRPRAAGACCTRTTRATRSPARRPPSRSPWT